MISRKARGGIGRFHAYTGGGAILFSVVAYVCSATLSLEPADVASIRLACTPASRGVRCRAVALFRNVRHAPRDVTEHAVWTSTGDVVTMRHGMLESTTPVTTWVEVRYQHCAARVQVRLRPDQAGQLLANIHGHAYIQLNGSLVTLPGVRVEIVSGPNAGRSATTGDDGAYNLSAIEPGPVVVRFRKPGYDVEDVPSQILVGENIVNPLLALLSARRPVSIA